MKVTKEDVPQIVEQYLKLKRRIRPRKAKEANPVATVNRISPH
jgi:hypothetical protein